MKWRLYDELVKKRLFAKIGGHGAPAVARTESGPLRSDEV